MSIALCRPGGMADWMLVENGRDGGDEEGDGDIGLLNPFVRI